MLRMRWLAPEELKQREWSPCPLEAVVPSPRVDGYRNKCEFSIGRDGAGQPCVGFVLGRFKQGVVAIGPPHGCPNVSAHMKGLAAAVQRAVATSALPPFDKVSSEGFCTPCTNKDGAVIAVLQTIAKLCACHHSVMCMKQLR